MSILTFESSQGLARRPATVNPAPRLLASLRAYLAVLQSRRLLAGLSERQLRDVGLERSHVAPRQAVIEVPRAILSQLTMLH